MLLELSVQNLGVIESSSFILSPGVSALTGETGAGKTMVVQAIELLTGGRADGSMVRRGADHALVEGRFETPEGAEIILKRVIPSKGRSRAYVDGSLAGASQLSEIGLSLVDLHGQHQHQSLLNPKTQRSALDVFAKIDLRALSSARSECRRLQAEIEGMGGDAKARAREVDLLKFQIDEITALNIQSPDELNALEKLEELLTNAEERIEAGGHTRERISGDGGLLDQIGETIQRLGDDSPYREITERLRGIQAEMSDVSAILRERIDGIEDDPQRLMEVGGRRKSLIELQRKYGDTLAEVIAYQQQASERLLELESHDVRAAALETKLLSSEVEVAENAAKVANNRRKAAPHLASEVSKHLSDLALENARLLIDVRGEDPADDVEIMFRANSGTNWHGLSNVASGGELARVMLALRLVLTSGPPTLVFDEVDAGIGGTAALSVGKALSRLGLSHQVLVVTHLPQVAAYADNHIVVDKLDDGNNVVSTLNMVDGDARVRELTRMLAGQPESISGRNHATELLEQARNERDSL